MSFRTVNGSTHTEDGWRCCNTDECDVSHIPDLFFTDTAPLRTGPPHIILSAWLFWYDRNVDEITSPVWGWSQDNDVLGGFGENNGSNHLSATAVDVNAPKYPWGAYTMPQNLIDKVEAGLDLFSIDGERGVFWGRYWDKPDEMHFQMAWPEGDPRNDQLMAKLLGGYLGIYGPAPADPAPTPAPAPKPAPTPADSPAKVLYDAIPIIDEARAAQLAPLIVPGLALAQCNTPRRIAEWLAQIGHESDGFNATEEYQKDGPGWSDDRRTYIGRTWIQITWRSNYLGFSQWAYDHGLVDSPTYFADWPAELAQDKWAAIGPAWYWTVARPQINALCDAGDLVGVTKAINGGTNGLYEPGGRQDRYNQALALGDRLLLLVQDDTPPTETEGPLMALTDDEQDELLTKVREIWDQLRGPGGNGWPQLGQRADGSDLTPVDALATLTNPAKPAKKAAAKKAPAKKVT